MNDPIQPAISQLIILPIHVDQAINDTQSVNLLTNQLSIKQAAIQRINRTQSIIHSNDRSTHLLVRWSLSSWAVAARPRWAASTSSCMVSKRCWNLLATMLAPLLPDRLPLLISETRDASRDVAPIDEGAFCCQTTLARRGYYWPEFSRSSGYQHGVS